MRPLTPADVFDLCDRGEGYGPSTRALLLLGAVAPALSEQAPAVSAPQAESMTFYVVKGAPDSCGRGCDSWIEADGKIESDTAARLKKFLERVRDRNLPILCEAYLARGPQAVQFDGHSWLPFLLSAHAGVAADGEEGEHQEHAAAPRQ